MLQSLNVYPFIRLIPFLKEISLTLHQNLSDPAEPFCTLNLQPWNQSYEKRIRTLVL